MDRRPVVAVGPPESILVADVGADWTASAGAGCSGLCVLPRGGHGHALNGVLVHCRAYEMGFVGVSLRRKNHIDVCELVGRRRRRRRRAFANATAPCQKSCENNNETPQTGSGPIAMHRGGSSSRSWRPFFASFAVRVLPLTRIDACGFAVIVPSAKLYRRLFFPATAGSILRASTRAEVAHVVSGLEHGCGREVSRLSPFSVDLFRLRLYPAHAGKFNLAILRDPEQGGNVGNSVSVRDRIGAGIVEQHWKSNANSFVQRPGLLRSLLPNSLNFT